MKHEEVTTAALALNADERISLAQTLLASVEPVEVQQAWLEEAERRFEDYQNENVTPISAVDAKNRIRAALG